MTATGDTTHFSCSLSAVIVGRVHDHGAADAAMFACKRSHRAQA
jgi:hypothetical protein